MAYFDRFPLMAYDVAGNGTINYYQYTQTSKTSFRVALRFISI